MARNNSTRRRSRSSMQQQKKSKRRWVFFGVFALLILVTSAAAGMWFASTSLFQKVPRLPGRSDKGEELLYASDKATILIMGVDQRDADARTGEEYDVGRSDTLMVAMLDPKKNKASLLSIPRDTRVRIKGLGWDKINAAYAYEDEKLTRSTVERFLGTNMDHYVLVKKSNFPRIIDAIGGVDIDVETRMEYEDPWDTDGGLYINLYPGMQHMDGKTAVTYVRYRDEEGDIGRVRRQQNFMKAVMEKVTSPAIIPRLPMIIREVFDAVETDMSVRQVLELAGSMKKARENGLQTDFIDGKPAEIDGVFYWIPDISDVRERVARVLDIRMTDRQRRAMNAEEAEYDASLPPQTNFTDPEENARRGLVGGGSYSDVDEETRARRRDSKRPPQKEKAEERKTETRRSESERLRDEDSRTANGRINDEEPRARQAEDEEERSGNELNYINNGGGETEPAVAPEAPTAPTAPSRPVSPSAGGKSRF